MNEVTNLEDGLDRFGGDLARWPADARGEAQALLARSADARDLLARMAEVEAGLRAPAAAASLPQFAAIAMRQRQLTSARRSTLRAAWGAAAAAALLIGIVVGSTRIDMHEDTPDQVVASALDGGGAGDVD